MLENIRENSQGMVAKIILGFIILVFAATGIGSYTNSVDTSVAEVNGVKISQAEFDKAYQQKRNQMVQQYGESFEAMSSIPSQMAIFRQGVVDELINQQLIDQAADSLSIRVSDNRIKRVIREMPAFQIDGKFDNNRYLALINQNGFYQPSDFRDYLRQDMTRRQLSQALVSSEFSLPYQEKQLLSLQAQKRDIRYATIAASQYKESTVVSEDDINAYYQENQTRFQNEEKVKVDYIAIDVNEIAKGITVSEQDVQDYYNDNIANYRQDEARRAAHILIELGDDESAAREKIEAIKQRVANGEDFAQLAQELSADTFSGENGGDLEWLERGDMDDDSFDDAFFALTEVGQVTDIVETEFGLHLIKLTELEAEQTKALADVADELRVKVSKEKAQDKFFELQQKAAELSFEVPDSLEDAAEAVATNIQTSEWISRSGNSLPFDNAKLVDAAFSELVVQEQLNSDIIEVNENLAVVLRVNQYQPANVKPLSEVSAQINDILVNQKAQEKAQSVAEELLAAFSAGDNIDEALTTNNASFEIKPAVARYGSGLDANLIREAFKLPHPVDGNVSASHVSLQNGDIALLEVTAVTAEEEIPEAPRFAQQLTQQLAQAAYVNYIETLKVDAKITSRTSVQASNQY